MNPYDRVTCWFKQELFAGRLERARFRQVLVEEGILTLEVSCSFTRAQLEEAKVLEELKESVSLDSLVTLVVQVKVTLVDEN